MKVLLLGTNGRDPEEGGGFTLAQDVFEGILRGSEARPHEFCILEDSDQVRLPANFARISQRRTLGRRITGRLEQIVQRVSGTIARPRVALPEPYLRDWQAKLRSQGVDCILTLNPFHVSPVLPNIVMVWDVEHRRKPYFPEVSDDGEWEKRERHFQSILPPALAVITGTQEGKRQVEHFYGVEPENVRVIPFPTPSFVLNQSWDDVSRSDLPPGVVDGEYLFYPAQYWPHKNHIRLLQAVRILRDRYDWRGSLICCGSDKGNLAYLEAQAKAIGIADQVRFLRFVTQRELVALYRHALAMPFLSYFGPDNLPPLEAFALGCPVIASAIEGADEAYGTAAHYVNPDDATAVASAVWRLRSDHEIRSELVAAGQARATESTVEIYVDRLLGLLDELESRFQCFRAGAPISFESAARQVQATLSTLLLGTLMAVSMPGTVEAVPEGRLKCRGSGLGV